MPATPDFRKLRLPPEATIHDAMEVMTRPPGPSIVLVTGKADKLLGIVVDSDLRKAMLKGRGLDTPLSRVMNPRPFTLPHTLSREALTQEFRRFARGNIPLVDRAGRVRGVANIADYLDVAQDKPNAVVLLVGGLGKRLRPLTEHRPKPLLPVGDKPILETIVDQFAEAGFREIFLAVHHHAEQIRRHFGDGKRFGVRIRYLHERRPLGTAGPLALLRRPLRAPLIVMNGDLLTKVRFQSLLDFHAEAGALATVCVREYDFQVPYGVIQLSGHHLEEIVEKPVHRFFVNAGIYVLDPRVLKWVPRGRRFDMPALLSRIRRERPSAIACFPIREYWIDIGRHDEYDKAQSDYAEHF